MRYILLLLFTFSVQATPLKLTWENPTAREDNTPLVLSFTQFDLRTVDIYYANCDTGDVGLPLFIGLPAFLTYKQWDGFLGDCVRLTVTDSEGRTSRFSEIMRPWDSTQPRPITCK